MACGRCPAWAAGRLPGAGHGVRGAAALLLGCCAARALRKKRGFSLCLGADVCSPSRQRVSFFKGNSLPPAPPYSPLFGTAKEVFFIGLYPARRVSRGRRRGPSRPCRVRSAPAAALRPPSGRTGSPSRPRHRCASAEGRRARPCRKTISVENRRGKLCRAAGRYEADEQGKY